MSELDPAVFTHLHVHSRYSLLKATAAIDDLVTRAADSGMEALALTDLNSLYGAFSFSQACQQAGIRPITGMTVTLAPPLPGIASRPEAPAHLILLATGPEGYRSLCRLSACLQGHPDREDRLQRGLAWDDLKRHHHGLICIEAGQTGWMAHYLRTGQEKAARQYASRLGGIFFDRCYLGLAINSESDKHHARALLAAGSRFGMEPVVAQPITGIEPEEALLLPLLAAIERNCAIEEVTDTALAGHWLSPGEIADRFTDFPEAIANVSAVIDACGMATPAGDPIWPRLDLPDGQTAAEAVAAQANQGLAGQLDAAPPADHAGYQQRLDKELASIIGHGFAPLFLLVADIVRFAHLQDVPVSTRGSVANSLTAYSLGITTVDPVAHGLLFERFLNPARANMPDIDLDFCSRRRDEVISYVRQRYGEDRVAMVGTMNTLQPKSAVRGVAKAYGITESRIKQLSGLVKRNWHPDRAQRKRPDLDELLDGLTNSREREVMSRAFQLIGFPHHLGLHPGGVIITPGPLTDVVPVQWATKGLLTAQYDFRDVEALGLPKIDLLGIRALTVLADGAAAIREQHDPAFRLAQIPLDDPTTQEMLARGATVGVFQCESSGAQRTLRQLKARTVRDLAVANAFFKPGPATGGMAKSFVRRYRGEEPVTFLHDSLAPILEPTQGVMLFQEQVLRIAVEIAGLSWGQADHLRRGMSKFRAGEMSAIRIAFVTGCCRPSPAGPGFTASQADTLWEQVMAFAGYGFNQGHATAYADVSYRSAYLKAHYPAEFLCARLMDYGGFHNPVIYMAEARHLGIGIMPPHVNVSRRKVSLTYPGQLPPLAPGDDVDGPLIWLGLGQIRNLRRRSIQAIREGRPFASLPELLAHVSLQAQELSNLIKCGALDGLGESRAALLAQAQGILRAGSARQMAFGFALETSVPAESAAQRLAWEKEILGMPVSVHPLQLTTLPPGVPLRQLPQEPGRRVRVSAVRLPGYTGGKGFFLGDGDSYLIADGGDRPELWQPVSLHGRYRLDEWGGGWFQIEESRPNGRPPGS